MCAPVGVLYLTIGPSPDSAIELSKHHSEHKIETRRDCPVAPQNKAFVCSAQRAFMQKSPKIVPLAGTSEPSDSFSLSLNPLQLAPDAGAVSTLRAGSRPSAFSTFAASAVSTTASTGAISPVFRGTAVALSQTAVASSGRRASPCSGAAGCPGSRHSKSLAPGAASPGCTACVGAHDQQQCGKGTRAKCAPGALRPRCCTSGQVPPPKSRDAARRAQCDVLCAKIALGVVLSAFAAALLLILFNGD